MLPRRKVVETERRLSIMMFRQLNGGAAGIFEFLGDPH